MKIQTKRLHNFVELIHALILLFQSQNSLLKYFPIRFAPVFTLNGRYSYSNSLFIFWIFRYVQSTKHQKRVNPFFVLIKEVLK